MQIHPTIKSFLLILILFFQIDSQELEEAPLPSVMSIGIVDPIETPETEIIFLPQQCNNIQPFGAPINVFHRYLGQTINIFNPKNPKLQIKLIYFQKISGITSNFRFVFKLKNNFANRWEYVGIISMIPQSEKDAGTNNHTVLRYINTTKIKDLKYLLGIDDIEEYEESDLECEKMKETWLSNLMKSPYYSTDCKPTEVPGCVRSRDLSQLFQLNFFFLQSVMKEFGFEVTIGELGFNPRILASYREAFKEFPFILQAISQIQNMITMENRVNQDILQVTADKRKKPECENILDLKKECSKTNVGTPDCLSEAQARTLINYMIAYYMNDTKTILPANIIEGFYIFYMVFAKYLFVNFQIY